MKDHIIEVDKERISVECGAYESKKGGQYFACKVYFNYREKNEFWKIVSFDLPEIAKIAGLSITDFISSVV